MKSINPQGKDPKEKIVIVIALITILGTLYLKIFTPYFD